MIRAGARRNAPARRSNRLKDVKTGFSCQAEEGSQPSTPKSLSALELHVAEMQEGNVHKHVVNDTNVYDKSHFLDHEDDTDNIDDFIAETPHDIMFTKAIYEENEDLCINHENVEFNAREKIKNS